MEKLSWACSPSIIIIDKSSSHPQNSSWFHKTNLKLIKIWFQFLVQIISIIFLRLKIANICWRLNFKIKIQLHCKQDKEMNLNFQICNVEDKVSGKLPDSQIDFLDSFIILIIYCSVHSLKFDFIGSLL